MGRVCSWVWGTVRCCAGPGAGPCQEWGRVMEPAKAAAVNGRGLVGAGLRARHGGPARGSAGPGGARLQVTGWRSPAGDRVACRCAALARPCLARPCLAADCGGASRGEGRRAGQPWPATSRAWTGALVPPIALPPRSSVPCCAHPPSGCCAGRASRGRRAGQPWAPGGPAVGAGRASRGRRAGQPWAPGDPPAGCCPSLARTALHAQGLAWRVLEANWVSRAVRL